MDDNSKSSLGVPSALVVSPVATEGVRVERHGACQIVTLDRPASRNALDRKTTSALSEMFPRIARDSDTYAVVLRAAGSGAFCAGGDIRELSNLAVGDPAAAADALAAEYRLVWLLECFSKPVVSLMDGSAMGAGAGITLVNTHRVAAADYAFAMPEVHIGLFPDDGVSWVLSRMPDNIGIYLALTGDKLTRSDAYALGLVTHCIDASEFAVIERQLADAEPVDPVLDRLHRDPGAGTLAPLRTSIAACFGAATVEDIMANLENAARQSTTPAIRAWAAEALARMQRASPFALKITLQHVHRCRELDLRQTLTIDYRLAVKLIASYDFREGVRSILIDKDYTPHWRPQALSDISQAKIEDMFRPTPESWLNLRTRQEMQAARV